MSFNLLNSRFLMILDYFLPQTTQFHKSTYLFCLVLLTLEFFVCSIISASDATHFHCFYIIYSRKFLGFLISSFISLYSLSTLFTKKIHHD